jgi:hypothetical protein
MPIGSQPSGRRGTVGHPYRALNLWLALALLVRAGGQSRFE